MNTKPLLLENLKRYAREADEAVARRERQVRACIEAGHGTNEIAAALGVVKSAVSNRRRRLKESERWKTG